MQWLWYILIALVFGAGGAFGGYLYRKQATETKIGRTEEYAKHLYDDAVRKADEYKKEKNSTKVILLINSNTLYNTLSLTHQF